MSDSKKILFYKSRLVDHAPFFEKRKYGYQYQNFDNEKLTAEIHYEIDITCKTQNTWNDFVFEIDRKQIYINQKEPQLLIEKLLDKCSKAIFPLKIIPAKDGTISGICNHEEIIARWKTFREQLASYYYSDLAYKVLNKIQKLILNKKELEKSLQLDWFFHLYFSPVYVDYPLETPINYNWKSPVFGNQTIDYLVSHTIEKNYSATNKIIINAKGKSIDERSLSEVLKGINYPQSKLQAIPYQPLESEMEVQYKLYAEDRNLFSIVSTFKTKINETRNKIQKIGLYHLVENENFRPESDARVREFRTEFEKLQEQEEEDIIDLSKMFNEKKDNLPTVYRRFEKVNDFFVEEIQPKSEKKLWEKLASIFKRKKK